MTSGFNKSIFFLLLLLAMLIASITSEAARLALIIGNGEYRKFNPLSNPVNDAKDMARVLGQLGFQVMLKTDVDNRTMTRAVQDFGRMLAQQGGVGLFYFSGHGVQYQGRNFLVPLHTEIRSDADIEFETLDAQRVLQQMEAASNGVNIIILDACRESYHPSSIKNAGRGLARMDSPAGSLIAYATAPGTVAYGGEVNERNSIYTKHLLRALQTMPQLSIADLLTEVNGQVFRETQQQDQPQVPWQASSLTQRFCFGGCGGNDALQAPTPFPPPVPTKTPQIAGGAAFRITDIRVSDSRGRLLSPVNEIYSVRLGETIAIAVTLDNPGRRSLGMSWTARHGDVPPVSGTKNSYTAKKVGADYVIVYIWDQENGEELQAPVNIRVVK